MMMNRAEIRYWAEMKFIHAKASCRIPTHVGLSCSDCGEPAYGYDHRDYRKPFDVEPICRQCNSDRGPGLPLPAPDNVRWEVQA